MGRPPFYALESYIRLSHRLWCSDPSKPYANRFAFFSTPMLRPRSPFATPQDTMAARPPSIHNVALSASLPSPSIPFWPPVPSSVPPTPFYYPGGTRKTRSNSFGDRNMLWKDMSKSPRELPLVNLRLLLLRPGGRRERVTSAMITVPKRSRTLSEAAKRVKIRSKPSVSMLTVYMLTPEIAQGFIKVVSEALSKIEAEEGTRSALLTMMIAVKSEGRSSSIEGEGAETLVETLDQVWSTLEAPRDALMSPISSSCGSSRTRRC